MTFYLIIIFSSLIALLGVVLAFGGLLSATSNSYKKLLLLYLPTIGLSIVISKILSNRNIDMFMVAATSHTLDDSFGNSFLITNLLRMASYGILSLSIAMVINYFFMKKIDSYKSSGLLLVISIYFIFSFVLNGVFGTVPNLEYKFLFGFSAVVAFYIGQSIEQNKLINSFKFTLLTTTFLAILFGLFAPKIAVQTNYHSGLLPFLDFRLWGVSFHANTLGPLSTILIITEIVKPYSKRWFHIFSLSVPMVTLILSQSKTAWVCFLIFLLCFLTFNQYLNYKKTISNIKFKVLSKSILIYILLIFFAITSWLYFQDAFQDDILNNQEITSFTGRDFIWRVTLECWHDNILFGYGPKIWGAEFSANYHLLGIASNGHNQLVNALGSAGILGLSSTLLYLFTLLYLCVRLALNGEPLAMYLLTVLLVRSITEVPFSFNLISEDFLVHLFLLGIIFTGNYRQAYRKTI